MNIPYIPHGLVKYGTVKGAVTCKRKIIVDCPYHFGYEEGQVFVAIIGTEHEIFAGIASGEIVSLGEDHTILYSMLPVTLADNDLVYLLLP